ncbi:hypothetical protein MIB92_12180 [Aestuariirhabdus sp. Z084]|uniref:hypothetical protein n=1 Tax=Aestuariirhabdus haliotis TaxID=2918751 RepID=UPI00201B3E68|nr:hypothetical protein [Aestuariirhabdus haliotis]MCL6416411.1 hypothetical protein [Aestuariirhabdus haliotis]MCL6420423.1 hypothetical protein [Aestuariirhabdus haliotis]
MSEFVFVSVFLFLIPLCVPGRKGFWLSGLLIGTPIACVWLLYFYQLSQPGYQSSPGTALGLAIVGVPTCAFLFGLFARYCRWLVQLKMAERTGAPQAQKRTRDEINT